MRQIRGFAATIAIRGDLTICQKRLYLFAGCADYPIATNDPWLLAPAGQLGLRPKRPAKAVANPAADVRDNRAKFDAESVRGQLDRHSAWMSG
jgi:hypothetical protein